MQSKFIIELTDELKKGTLVMQIRSDDLTKLIEFSKNLPTDAYPCVNAFIGLPVWKAEALKQGVNFNIRVLTKRGRVGLFTAFVIWLCERFYNFLGDERYRQTYNIKAV